jgi:hypothetical protein
MFEEFLNKLNPFFEEFFREYTKVRDTDDKLKELFKLIKYPFSIYTQRLGSTKDEILKTLENEGVKPYSIPFLYFNDEDKNFYLVYHTINKEKSKYSYPNNSLTFEFVDYSKDDIYFHTIPYLNKTVKETLIDLFTNKSEIKAVNYSLRRKERNMNFINFVKHFSKNGFAIIPIVPLNGKNPNPQIVLVPKSIMEFPNIFSIEHEIDVKDVPKAQELFDIEIVNHEPFPLFLKGEYETKDGSLDPITGHEFIIGTHLFTNLIYKTLRFLQVLKDNQLLFGEYTRKNELPKPYYGMHISTSVPNLIDSELLYTYLHNIGILYDLLTRHKEGLEQWRNLSCNDLKEFVNGERGIFRFLSSGNIKDYLENLNFKDIIHIANPKKYFSYIYNNLLSPSITIYHKDNLLNYLNYLLIEYKGKSNDEIYEIINSELEGLNNDIDAFEYSMTPNEKILSILNKLLKLIKEESSEKSTVDFLRGDLSNLYDFAKVSNYENYLISAFKKLENIFKTVDEFIKSGNYEELEKYITKINENYSNLELLNNEKYKKLYNQVKDYIEFLDKNKERIKKDVDTLKRIINTIRELNLNNYSDILNSQTDNYYTLKKFMHAIYESLPENSIYRKTIEKILNLIKLNSVNILNRLEVRYIRYHYKPDYIINNLIFTAKMTKDLFKLGNTHFINDFINFPITHAPSNWSEDEQLRVEEREELKENKELKEFILKNILGFKKSEIKIFNQYFKKYC